MVKEDRRKDTATAMAISAALRQEAEYGYEIAPRQAVGTAVPAELAEHLLHIGIDRRSPENADDATATSASPSGDRLDAESLAE